MEIISQDDYIELINSNKHHFKNLIEIVQKSGDILEGDCMYEHLTFTRKPELLPKQRNLHTVAKSGNKIIEIGFNAGNSALLFLLANPNAYLWCFDICQHSYTRPCFQYLYDNFGQRLSLYAGSSIDTVPAFLRSHPNQTYDIFHIDGSHDRNIANIDFFTCFDLAHHQSIMIWDDVDIPDLKQLWNGYISMGKVFPISLLPTPMYSHAIGLVWKPKIKIAVCSLTIGEQYKDITKYGRKSKVLYCQKYGYDFFDEETDVDHNRAPAWSKINILRKHLRDYEYLVWMDGDTLLMNDKIKLEQLILEYSNGKDITVAQDWTMINTGVMLVKNTEWTMKFLDLIYDQIQFMNHNNWEQGAFINLLENNISDSKNHINVLPLGLQNKLNSYWFTYYFNDCFILHFPGCWRENVEHGLSIVMNKYCPIQMDHETPEQHQARMNWLEHTSRNDIDDELKRWKSLEEMPK